MRRTHNDDEQHNAGFYEHNVSRKRYCGGVQKSSFSNTGVSETSRAQTKQHTPNVTIPEEAEADSLEHKQWLCLYSAWSRWMLDDSK